METTSPQVATVSSYRHSTQHACAGGAPHVPSSHAAGMFWLRLRQPPKRHVRGANIPQQPMERDPLVRVGEDVCERTRRAGGLGTDPSRGRGGRCMQVSEDVCEAGVARRRASNECEPQVESGGAHLSEDVCETCIACGRSAECGRLWSLDAVLASKTCSSTCALLPRAARAENRPLGGLAVLGSKRHYRKVAFPRTLKMT